MMRLDQRYLPQKIRGHTLTMTAILVLLSAAGCQPERRAIRQPVDPKTPAIVGTPLVSDNGQTQLTLPKGWQAQTAAAEQPLNLSMTSPTADAYLTLHTQAKEKLVQRKLTEMAELNYQASSQALADFKISPTPVRSVNGYPAVQYELRGSLDNVKMVLLLTTVETPDYFHQLLAGTSQFSYERYQKVLQQIIQSLREDDPADAQS